MNGKITYHQQVSYCGKTRCKKCREGIGHGPYWYAYKTTNGHTTRTYIGKDLPPDAQDAREIPMSSAKTSFTNSALNLNTVVLRISILGQFRLERRNTNLQWQPVTDAAWQDQHVIRALLALLICTPERKISRTRAMTILWSRTDQETASINLNKLISRLRIILEPTRRRSSAHAVTQLLRTEGDELILADQSRVWVDADAFTELLTAARSLIDTNEVVDADFVSSPASLAIEERESLFQSSAPPPVSILPQSGEQVRERLLREAAALYGGDFWPEERQIDWVSSYRQALKRDWLRLMLDLSDLYIWQGATANAISILDRLLANDPANESGVQRLIVVLAKLNRRGEALRAYHRLSDILQREYKTLPLEETQLLYETIRLGGTLPDSYSQQPPATKPAQSGSLFQSSKQQPQRERQPFRQVTQHFSLFLMISHHRLGMH